MLIPTRPQGWEATGACYIQTWWKFHFLLYLLMFDKHLLRVTMIWNQPRISDNIVISIQIWGIVGEAGGGESAAVRNE